MPSSTSLYRRMSLWFHRRGSNSSAAGTPNSTNTNTDSPASSVSSVSSRRSSVSSASSSPIPTHKRHDSTDSPVMVGKGLSSRGIVSLTRTVPSAHANEWITESVLLNEPVDMSYTPFNPTVAASAHHEHVAVMNNTKLAASHVSLLIQPDTAAPVVPHHRRVIRPRHFTFSDAHVTRSANGRLARTTAFF